MRVPAPNEMKQFLYGETPEAEARKIEEQLFEDSDLFYELTSLEHELVDSYVRGKLTGEELRRFEKALIRSDERKEQVLDARALQRLIKEENRSIGAGALSDPSGRQGGSQVFDSASFQTAAMRYALAAVVVLLTLCTAWFSFDAYRARNRLADARAQLERERDDAKRQIEELRAEVAKQNGDGNRELREQEAKLTQLQEEVERLRTPQEKGESDYTATITEIGSRGVSDAKVIRRAKLQVTVKVPLETQWEYNAYTIYDADGSQIPARLKITSDKGMKYLIFSLPVRNLKIEITGTNNETGAKERKEYRLEVRGH